MQFLKEAFLKEALFKLQLLKLQSSKTQSTKVMYDKLEKTHDLNVQASYSFDKVVVSEKTIFSITVFSVRFGCIQEIFLKVALSLISGWFN